LPSRIKSILEKTKGSEDVYKKANEGVEYFELKFNKKALGYYGVTQEDINRFLNSMVSGVSVGVIQEGMRRIALVIKGDKSLQSSLDKIAELYYPLNNQESVALSKLVTFKKSSGPVQIEHENGYRKTVVQSNVEGRDLVGFVDEVKRRVEEEVNFQQDTI